MSTAEEELKQEIIALKRELSRVQRLHVDKVSNAEAPVADLQLLTMGIAHEFNNILGAADGHAEWALDSGELKDAKDALEVIRKACARSSKITKALKGVFQPREEKRKFFYIVERILKVIELFDKNLKFQSIKVDVTQLQDFEIYGTEESFDEIIINLLKNAIDALVDSQKSEKKTISISTLNSPSKTKDSKNILVISDNAEGISENVKERIFTPFFTTKGSMEHVHNRDSGIESSVGSGMGLGLYVVQVFLKEFSATIDIDSKKSVGSRFVLTFPNRSEAS